MKVWNKRDAKIPNGAIYVGRPSIWGNPFEIGRDGTREDVISKHKEYLFKNTILLERLPELKGKDLVCCMLIRLTTKTEIVRLFGRR